MGPDKISKASRLPTFFLTFAPTRGRGGLFRPHPPGAWCLSSPSSRPRPPHTSVVLLVVFPFNSIPHAQSVNDLSDDKTKWPNTKPSKKTLMFIYKDTNILRSVPSRNWSPPRDCHGVLQAQEIPGVDVSPEAGDLKLPRASNLLLLFLLSFLARIRSFPSSPCLPYHTAPPVNPSLVAILCRREGVHLGVLMS